MFNFFRRKKTENRDMAIGQFKNIYSGGFDSLSGILMTPDLALKISVVHACVKILAESIASMPLVLYQRTYRETNPAKNHPLYRIMSGMPSVGITSYEMRETIQGHLGLFGNGYAYVRRDGGTVVSVTPLHPSSVEVRMNPDGEIIYRHQSESGVMPIQRGNMLHVKYWSPNGIVGYSPLRLASENIGLTKAVDEYAARYFANDASPGGVLEHPGKLGDTAYEHLKASWAEAHAGGNNAHRPAILEEGMKWSTIGKDPASSQLLDVRKFNIAEICRIYRIPPHMVAELDRSTNNNIEHQGLEFVVHTLTPWMVRWEQSLNETLLTQSERDAGYYFKFNDRRLMRGDSAGRAEYYSKMLTMGVYSINEVRALEDMNPIDGGDTPQVQANMITLDKMINGVNPAGTTPNANSRGKFGGGFESVCSCGHSNRGSDLTDSDKDTIAIQPIRNIQDEYLPKLNSASDDIVKYEVSEIKKAVAAGRADDVNDFIDHWLADFYDKMPDRVRDKMQYVLWAYQDSIYTHASRMVGKDKIPSGKEFLKFKKSYLDALAKRHSDSSMGQIVALLDPLDPASFLSYLDDRLNQWDETRAVKIAENERVRAAWSAARETWKNHGHKRLRWVTRGSENCPYCRKMNGITVGIDDNFLNDGDVLTEQDDLGNWMKMKIYGHKKHPPIHGGCDCGIVPK